MFPLFSKSKEELTLLLDIGNGSIGASLVSFHPTSDTDPLPDILYTIREPLALLPTPSSKRLLDSMLALLRQVARNVQKSGLPNIDESRFDLTISQVIVVLASPWYASHTRIVTVQKDEPFLITKGLISGIVKSEGEKIRSELDTGNYRTLFGPGLSLLENSIIHTKIKGYEAIEPIGKQANELEMAFFLSFISTEIREKIEKALHAVFSFKKIGYSSFALSSWSALRDIFPDIQDFVSVDITNEITDLCLTNNGVLVETASFPYGRASLVRAVSKSCGISPEIARSHLALYANGSAHQEFKASLEPAISAVIASWQKAFTETLTTFVSRYRIPQTVFVTADPDLSPIFCDSLKKPLPARFSITHDLFDVIKIDPLFLKPFIYTDAGAVIDPFLGLECLFHRKSLLNSKAA